MSKKLQLGVFDDGILIMSIGASQDNTKRMHLLLNSIAGQMDAIFQELKVRDGVSDNTYIAYDYCEDNTKCM